MDFANRPFASVSAIHYRFLIETPARDRLLEQTVFQAGSLRKTSKLVPVKDL